MAPYKVTYKVRMFILGCDPKLTEEIEYVDAESIEKAEEYALWHRDGYGIISTMPMDLDYPNFSVEQVNGVEDRLHDVLKEIFTDNIERNNIVDSIFDKVMNDIDESSDWSNLDDDECCTTDIDISLQRVLYKIITNF